LVCIAISVAGDCSQDLKTGFLVKATPWKQQVGEMIGILTSVLAIAGVLLLLNEYQGFVKDADHPYPLAAPQANIMKILVEGVLGGNVPWELIIMGGAAAVLVELLGLPALPFAVGMYLPLGLSTPIMVGGLVRWLVTRKKKETTEHDPGVLTASGMVAGTGLMGVALVAVAALISWAWSDPRWMNPVSSASEPVTPAHFVPLVFLEQHQADLAGAPKKPHLIPLNPTTILACPFGYSAPSPPYSFSVLFICCISACGVTAVKAGCAVPSAGTT